MNRPVAARIWRVGVGIGMQALGVASSGGFLHGVGVGHGNPLRHHERVDPLGVQPVDQLLDLAVGLPRNACGVDRLDLVIRPPNRASSNGHGLGEQTHP